MANKKLDQLKIRKNMMTFDSQVIRNRMDRIVYKLEYASTLNSVIRDTINEVNTTSINPLTADKAYSIAGVFCAEALKSRFLDLGRTLANISNKEKCESKDSALFCIAGNWGDDLQHCTYHFDSECPVEVNVDNIEYRLSSCTIQVRVRTSWNLVHYVTGRKHVHHESMTAYFQVGELVDNVIGYRPVTNKTKVMNLLGSKISQVSGVK